MIYKKNWGKMKYVPNNVLQEMQRIKERENIQGKRTDKKAFDTMIMYSKAGRQIDDVMKFAGMRVKYKDKKK